MKNSIKPEEQILKLIHEGRGKYKGTFKASVDNLEFMFADTNVVFHRAGEEYYIVGADRDNKKLRSLLCSMGYKRRPSRGEVVQRWSGLER